LVQSATELQECVLSITHTPRSLPVSHLQGVAKPNPGTDHRLFTVFHFHWYIAALFIITAGQDRAVGIATRYGLDGPGIES